jgi:hypothetical protein
MTPGVCAEGATCTSNPAGVDFGGRNSQELANCNPPPDLPDCPTQDFVVTNTGPGTSGTPVPSIVVVFTVPGDAPAFEVFSTTCTAPLAPGASCIVTIRGAADDNEDYISRLDVTASPGNTVSATLRIQ